MRDLRARVEVKYCLKDGNISRLFLLPKPLRDRISCAKLLVQPRNNAPKSWKMWNNYIILQQFHKTSSKADNRSKVLQMYILKLQLFIYSIIRYISNTRFKHNSQHQWHIQWMRGQVS